MTVVPIFSKSICVLDDGARKRTAIIGRAASNVGAGHCGACACGWAPVTAHVETAEDFRHAIRAGVDELAHVPGGFRAWTVRSMPG